MTQLTDWDWRKIEESLAPGAAPDRAVPERLGKYRLVRELAQGAMGVVYEGEDSEIRRPVAVKILRDMPGASDVVRQRFQREARAAGTLSHPNVVRVYDAGEDGGRMFLVMELVQGRPLSDILGGRKHDTASMLRLLEKVARGVAAAHEVGIVHRDVKPANILVTEAGEPKVCDFGLAHWLDSDSVLTRTGAPLGTPMYMAPEQVRGGKDRISAATDVYALGAILYEILTGRPPHSADTTMELYTKIMNDEPSPPRRLSTRIPSELQTICLVALEKDPARRYPAARDFADDLRRHLNGEAILAKPPGPLIRGLKWAKRHRITSVAASITLAALAVVAGIQSANATARRRQVEGFVEVGRRALDDYLRTRAEIVELSAERDRLAASLRRAPEGEAKALWETRRKIREKELAAIQLATTVVDRFSSARGLDPEHRDAKAGLGTFHVAEFERACRSGDRQAMEVSRKQVELLDPSLAPKLVREGTISIDSRPAGAEIEVLRYVEGDDTRLVAEPFKHLGSGPAGKARLPAGSYLLVLRKQGFRDVRYPVLVEHGADHAATVDLYADDEIGKDFVCVPAGRFVMGGDPQSTLPSARQVVEAKEFFIGKSEVTLGEYVEFLDSIIADQGAVEAQKRAPRSASSLQLVIPPDARGVPRIEAEKLRWPVHGVSWNDASAYVSWRTARARRQGERASYRLPTSVEWEKAARGVDGRFYPWGNEFDPGFARVGRVSVLMSLPVPVGTFEKDESPYGIRDMVGNANEWCDDWFSEEHNCKVFRGGSWNNLLAAPNRCASWDWEAADGPPLVTLGFRLVRVPVR